MKTWTTKDGKEIEYKNLGDKHLMNILNFLKLRAKELDGQIIDGGGIDAEDIWYVEGSEEDWLRAFDYYGIEEEAKKRGLLTTLK